MCLLAYLSAETFRTLRSAHCTRRGGAGWVRRGRQLGGSEHTGSGARGMGHGLAFLNLTSSSSLSAAATHLSRAAASPPLTNSQPARHGPPLPHPLAARPSPLSTPSPPRPVSVCLPVHPSVCLAWRQGDGAAVQPSPPPPPVPPDP